MILDNYSGNEKWKKCLKQKELACFELTLVFIN